MEWIERLPGMTPGRRLRNLVVGVGYLLAAPIVVAVLPVLVIGIVTANYQEAATRLSRLPGVTPDGGITAGVAAGVYVFVLWAVVLSAAGVGVGSPGFGVDEAETPSTTDDVDGNETADSETAEISEEEIVVLFETVISQSGVDIESIDRENDVLSVEYTPSSTIDGDIPEDVDETTLEEMGYIAGGYVGAIEEGLETGRMDVTVLDPSDGEPASHWTVETEWANAYHAGEITMDDIADRSLATVERVDE